MLSGVAGCTAGDRRAALHSQLPQIKCEECVITGRLLRARVNFYVRTADKRNAWARRFHGSARPQAAFAAAAAITSLLFVNKTDLPYTVFRIPAIHYTIGIVTVIKIHLQLSLVQNNFIVYST